MRRSIHSFFVLQFMRPWTQPSALCYIWRSFITGPRSACLLRKNNQTWHLSKFKKSKQTPDRDLLRWYCLNVKVTDMSRSSDVKKSERKPPAPRSQSTKEIPWQPEYVPGDFWTSSPRRLRILPSPFLPKFKGRITPLPPVGGANPSAPPIEAFHRSVCL